MDKTERLIESQSREGFTASQMQSVQELMRLKQPNDRESCDNSSHGSDRLDWDVKGRSKGSNHQGQSKVMATGKKRTEAVLDQVESLHQKKKRKYRSIVEIYAETEPVDVGDVR